MTPDVLRAMLASLTAETALATTIIDANFPESVLQALVDSLTPDQVPPRRPRKADRLAAILSRLDAGAEPCRGNTAYHRSDRSKAGP